MKTYGGVVIFIPLLLYPQGNSPLYSFDRRLCGPHVCLDTMEKRKILPLTRTEPWLSSPQPTAILTELPQLPMPQIIPSVNARFYIPNVGDITQNLKDKELYSNIPK
jgi:hypothetical protein